MLWSVKAGPRLWGHPIRQARIVAMVDTLNLAISDWGQVASSTTKLKPITTLIKGPLRRCRNVSSRPATRLRCPCRLLGRRLGDGNVVCLLQRSRVACGRQHLDGRIGPWGLDGSRLPTICCVDRVLRRPAEIWTTLARLRDAYQPMVMWWPLRDVMGGRVDTARSAG